MDRTIYQIIKQRRASSAEDPGDLLSKLMQARDEKDGSQMTDRQLRDEVCTLMIAGYETTANSLLWTWMLLSRHQEVQARVLEELRAVLGGRSPAAADLDRLPYTTMVVKESMRLYPPIWTISRETARECEIGGYEVPRGCMVMTSPWVMHRDPRFFDRPELFAPERWANGLEKRLPRGVYFPFGDGPHFCIGRNFALMETLLILATVIGRFQLLPVPHHLNIPQANATLRPRYGVRVILKKRDQICS
jgi:cytochrome P450